MMDYRITVCSHVGNSRSAQEDNYVAGPRAYLSEEARDEMAVSRALRCEEVVPDQRDYCAFVCDGMGGHAHGETASLTAARLLMGRYDELLRAAAAGPDAIKDVIARLNNEFCDYAAASAGLSGMGTTMCGVIVRDYHVYAVNVGDSRLYVYRDGGLQQITVDHTEGRRLQDMGFLTEEEVRRFPNRKAIYRYIGRKVELRPDVFEIDAVNPGAVLLIATDGLTDALSDGDICEILHNERGDLPLCGARLVEEAVGRSRGFGDNITLILAQF